MQKSRNNIFPALSPIEAEQIVRDLGNMLDADHVWAEKFRTMLVCRTKPIAADLKDDAHKRTVFGKWYYGQVDPKLREHPGFALVGKNNKRMHAIARELAQAVKDETPIQPRQYKAFTKSAGKFRNSLRKLLSDAWELLRYADPLTGVMTRGAMKISLEEEQERARRTGQATCLAMMDLDLFKNVNDTYGHQAGDKVLMNHAAFLQENLRRYDKVFRYGGEEFLILLPNTTVMNAEHVLNRIREDLGGKPVQIEEEQSIQVSASFGVAELLLDQPTKVSINRADQALYEAKKAGRNCVRVWLSSEMPPK